MRIVNTIHLPGIMLFVGDNPTHSHHWAARPQFCGKIIDTEYDEAEDDEVCGLTLTNPSFVTEETHVLL